MKKRIISIAGGIGLYIAAKLIWHFYMWTQDAYRAFGSGLDPRGLIPILGFLTLAGSGYMFYCGITGRYPRAKNDEQQTDVTIKITTNWQVIGIGANIEIIPTVLVAFVYSIIAINPLFGILEPLAWNLPIGILGGIIGALIGRSRKNDKKTVQSFAITGTLFGVIAGIILAILGIGWWTLTV